ncbi:MAG TPA: DUF4126 domain-containing protein [Alphaproteobacteria bacterium]|nr:DUF4126 domain-containing protein [Alphaproteobacteria bacterium]
MDLLTASALGLGAAWASGINLYAVVLTLGLMNAAGWIALPPELQPLSSPLVLGIAGALYVIEFIADKVPGVDHAWDALHSFIRVPAGAVLAAAAFGQVDPEWAIAAGLLGGTLALGSHLSKASTRTMVNLSPEPFSTWTVSLLEDIAAVVAVVAALFHPLVFLIALAIIVALTIWLLPKLLRAAARLFGTVLRWLRRAPGRTGAP